MDKIKEIFRSYKKIWIAGGIVFIVTEFTVATITTVPNPFVASGNPTSQIGTSRSTSGSLSTTSGTGISSDPSHPAVATTSTVTTDSGDTVTTTTQPSGATTVTTKTPSGDVTVTTTLPTPTTPTTPDPVVVPPPIILPTDPGTPITPVVTPAPTVGLGASPLSVTSGGSSTLSWTSSNATTCTASGSWSGAKATSGSISTGALSANATYSLSCTGPGGTASASPVTITVTAPVQSGYTPTGVSGSWTLKFDDEFSGTSLDTTKWSNCWFSPSCGKMNNVTTSASNVSVGGGVLTLTLASSSSGALVSTNPKGGATTGYQFTTGVAEARIFFPGNGTQCYNWPAWWTDSQNWPSTGENDIAEVLGGPMTVNYHSSSGSHNQGSVAGYWCGGYHTYTINRQVGKADVYFDGTKVKSYTTDDGEAPQYLVINVGYNSAYYAFGTLSQVKVDYVRAWQ